MEKLSTIEFINIICPEHGRTSCSDENISNGFYLDDDEETVSMKYYHRCTRCALLEIYNGKIVLTEENKLVIPERLNL